MSNPQAAPLRCPTHGCGGTLVVHIDEPNNHARRVCADCRAEYRLGAGADVAGFRMKTYSDEEIVEAVCGAAGWAVAVRGRLDLSASDVLDIVWQTLPAQARVLLDLTAATEFSAGGCEVLVRIGAALGERLAVVPPPESVPGHDDFAATGLGRLAPTDAPPEVVPKLTAAAVPLPPPMPPPPPPPIISGASQPPRRRRIEVEDIGDVTIVNFVDKKILDEQNVQMIGMDLFRLVDELGRRKVLLNFGNVEYMSSAALGKLITLHRKLQAVQGRFVMCCIAAEILEVFQVTKLDRMFAIRKTEQDGLQSF